MKIARLRLLGFKSFVEPTELVIERGLTGVVGPNGCGKSNLLEALRWVMGETSYKSMRGSAMDDVIFAGTDKRPSRNKAEVTIFLDNSERLAPAEFNDSDQIEVSRRIEREVGSAYKLNGKDVRARDIRLLFEDAATGARSPALVQQGRIGEIVGAKPQQRRRILEDAAGIAGLHSRRHEAELRLNAAESNLERLQDLSGQMSAQLQGLKRQARQAKRYKDLSGKVREADALRHHIYWTAACDSVEAEETAMQNTVREVGRLTAAEAEAITAQVDASEVLPKLRDEEATRGAVLHRLTVERDTLAKEEARIEERRRDLEARLEQMQRDIRREREARTEAADVLAGLEREEAELTQAIAGRADLEIEAREVMDAAGAELSSVEATLSEVSSAHAAARSERQQQEKSVQTEEARIQRAEREAAEIAAKLERVRHEHSLHGDMTVLAERVTRLGEDAKTHEDAVGEAEARTTTSREAEAEVREGARKTALRAQELETEVQTLTKLLRPSDDSTHPPIVDEMRVAPGFELALGAALGDDLTAPDDLSAPAHWRGILSPSGNDPELPTGVEPLHRFVEAPNALSRRLAQVGVVDRERGRFLQDSLKSGQRLVSREGDLWRWDGYTAAADAPTAAAMRLAERNRLEGLAHESETARGEAQAAEAELITASAASSQAVAHEKQVRETWRTAMSTLSRARDELAAAEHAARDASQELGALTEAQTRTAETLAEARQRFTDAQAALGDISAFEALEADLQAQRETVNEKRTAHADARAAFNALERELTLRQERLKAISGERTRWTNRIASADEQATSLTDRTAETETELESLAVLPEQIAERRQKLLNQVTIAEDERNAAADALAAADNLLRAADTALREIQGELGTAREERARIEARLEGARERRAEQARVIRDQLECAPEECLEIAALKEGAPLPSAEDADAKVNRLRAERERLGGVNLRAEEEAEELGGELNNLETEREDLIEAIAKLRHGISNLNREGRKRLLEAFEEVNGHFKSLFTTLFAGGEASLELVESDDPLESGLEIMARPPGKKPQVLSLLSGGEKALTALALIFAVFLTNPSPICVLDEVDAPLDDANVERFCKMMNEMTRMTDTRFLIITHHPVTMAQMNRLFGVTMAERGVSQLVSVTLEEAEQYLEAV